jgi:hypothetical protein
MTTPRNLALYLLLAAIGAGASLGVGHADNDPKAQTRPAPPSAAVSQANQLSDAFARSWRRPPTSCSSAAARCGAG